MPNRLIKESAFTSDKIAQLTDFEFRLWVGLITQADDAGRGDARPAIVKGRIFALRDRTALKDIERALQALAAHGCVVLYTVDGKPYYEFPNWAAHQRVRNAIPKYPAPDAENAIIDTSPRDAASCGELRRDAALIQSNPIQYESNPNPNPSVCDAPKRFTPPTIDDVTEYCRERGNAVDPQRFVDYYTANGWKVGKNPMKDWRAAVRTWERDSKPQKEKTFADMYREMCDDE